MEQLSLPTTPEEQAAFRRAAELLPDGLIGVDATRIITVVNSPAERICAVDRADLVGRDVTDAFALVDHQGRSWWDLTDPWHGLATRTGHREKLLLLPSGREVLVTARYLRNGPAEPLLAVMLALRDPIASQRSERDHAALIAAVAHELRSPLTGVKGFTASVLRNWDAFTDEQRRFMIQTVHADADRLSRLISSLLDVSRLDARRLVVHHQPLDVVPVLARHVERLHDSGQIRPVVIDVPAHLPAVFADPDRLDQIMSNLIDNAVKHGAGRIRLAAQLHGPAALDLTVDDAGPGIPAPLRSLIFARFWQSGASGSGSGLGLYLVRGLAEALGGSAEVEDGPAGGALFRIQLPLAA
ncbi:MAG: ATP-binding protein [Nostocoides sp.]